MAATPGVLGRRYLPFIALAAVQVLLVAIAPSKPGGGNGTIAAGGINGQSGAVDANGNPIAGGAVDANGNPIAAGANGGTGASGAAAAGGVGANGSAAGGAGGGGAGASGDMSHCDRNGREIGPSYYMPTCVPVWHGGNNGGGTMTGVSGTDIKYVFYVQQANPQVNAILSAQDLAYTPEQHCEAAQAFDKVTNKRYEMYGRHVVALDGPGKNKGSVQQSGCHFPYWGSQCSLTPPDPPCERAEADAIAAMKPAFVLAPVAGDDALYDQLAKDHVVTLGGELEPASYHVDDAPYYYDVFMDGTRAAKMMAEYYCKRLQGRPVRWAGLDVLRMNGAAAPPPKRKLAIAYPATNGDPFIAVSAKLFSQLVTGGECGSAADGAKGYPYDSDINTAQKQATTTVSSMKADHVTTVICMCDPIAPVFLTNAMDQQNYHPEQLMIGSGLLDYDKLGRLYNPNVWKYAFGLSHLQFQLPFDQSDAAAFWRDAGNSGLPDKTENLYVAYWELMGSMIQEAGPMLTPTNMRQGLFTAPVRGGWAESHGNPHYPMIVYRAPDDYTGINDAREVWWCKSAISSIDGEPGAYVQVDNGHRYDLGQWPNSDPAVFTTPCA